MRVSIFRKVKFFKARKKIWAQPSAQFSFGNLRSRVGLCGAALRSGLGRAAKAWRILLRKIR
jgi:hypothetical protein